MKGYFKLIILLVILLTGIIVQKTGILDISRALELTEAIAGSWWFPPLAVIVQVVMYMLAFPGSILMWTLGAIYQPWTATILVVAGGVTGGLAAYLFASSLSSSWTARLSGSKVFNILKKNSGFLHLCILRCLPGFPHSFINYSAGILKVKLLPFILSTALGFSIKGFIYCSAIYSAVYMDDLEDVISIANLWPLIILVIFFLFGIAVQKRYFSS